MTNDEVEQVVVAEACTNPRADGQIGPLSWRAVGSVGFDSPEHGAAQYGAQVTGHRTQCTTACGSATTRAGQGTSTQRPL